LGESGGNSGMGLGHIGPHLVQSLQFSQAHLSDSTVRSPDESNVPDTHVSKRPEYDHIEVGAPVEVAKPWTNHAASISGNESWGCTDEVTATTKCAAAKAEDYIRREW